MIKKYFTTFLMIAMLAVMVPLMASSAEAQTVRRVYNPRTGRYVLVQRPNFYQRHRKLVNIGVGAGTGLLLGGLLGGRKWAAIGALAGAGGGYLVTKKQKSKNYWRPLRTRTRAYRNY